LSSAFPLECEVTTEAGEVVNLEDLMVFFSGASAKSPLGFVRRPQLDFIEENLANSSTCSLFHCLQLDFSLFKKYMTLTLKGHNGFGQV